MIAWAGYAEDGSTDPKVDWVTDFEKQTGCQVNVKIGNTSDEMVTLMRTGQYDGVSASGDATLRLIAGGDVAPVNTDLSRTTPTSSPASRTSRATRSTARCTASRTAAARTSSCGARTRSRRRRTRGARCSTRRSPYKGKVTAYDNPIYIADAALYLKATQPDLKIDNPYELDDKQFQAAVDLLKQQRGNIGEYWSDYTKEQAAFANGDSDGRHDLAGHRQPARGRQGAGQDDAAEGGRDRLVGHLDDLLQGQAPELHVHVDGLHHLARRPTPQVAEWFGEAPANAKACAETADKNHCEIFHADDEAYFDKVVVLDDAAQGVRRRPRRGLQGLLRLGPGLDGDQGLS